MGGADEITAPSIFVVAENGELSGNAVAERVRQDLVKRGVPSDFRVIKGITHCGVCAEGFDGATRVELEWFGRHLKM